MWIIFIKNIDDISSLALSLLNKMAVYQQEGIF